MLKQRLTTYLSDSLIVRRKLGILGGAARLLLIQQLQQDFHLILVVSSVFSGEPTKGKTRVETILRQLTTKKGQVFLDSLNLDIKIAGN